MLPALVGVVGYAVSEFVRVPGVDVWRGVGVALVVVNVVTLILICVFAGFAARSAVETDMPRRELRADLKAQMREHGAGFILENLGSTKTAGTPTTELVKEYLDQHPEVRPVYAVALRKAHARVYGTRMKKIGSTGRVFIVAK